MCVGLDENIKYTQIKLSVPAQFHSCEGHKYRIGTYNTVRMHRQLTLEFIFKMGALPLHHNNIHYYSFNLYALHRQKKPRFWKSGC